MEGTWSLVGREAALAAIEGAFAEPEVSGVVVVGESGVGRTRLAREVGHRLAAAGCHVEWVAATVAPASVPFGAVGHLLPAETPPDGHPVAVVASVAAGLAALGGRDGVVLLVDDAHLLDAQSAALVAQVATQRSAFVVANVQRGQPVPEPIGGLWKDGVARRLDVDPLTSAEIDALIDEGLAGTVDSITRQRLRLTADGRPAVLRELLACGLDTGALRQRYGVWRWHGPVVCSRRVVEQIATRLATCSPDVRTVLEVVACGDPLPLHVLERLSDRAAIEAAERSGLLTVRRDGLRAEVRLASPLHAEAIRDRTPVTRTRRICGQLAEITAATPMRRSGDARRVAVWQMEAGEVSAPAVLLPAARQVMTSDPPLAEWCARAACGIGGGPEAYLLLAEILEYRGRANEAAAVLASSPGEPNDRGAWAATRATVSYWGLGRLDEAQEVLDLPSSETGHDLADALRTWLLLFDGSYEPALEVARAVLAQPSPSDQATVWAAAGGVGAAGLLGRLEEAMRLRHRGSSVADAHPVDLPWARAQMECAACAALYFCGHVRRAREIADGGYRAATALQEPLMLGIWAMLRGVLASAGGRPVAAQSLLREAIVLLEHTDTRLVDFCLAELAGATALAGDAVQLDGGVPDPPDGLDTAPNRAFDPWRARACAWARAGRGATSEAVALLLSAASSAGSPTAEAYLLYDVARLGAAAQVVERLDELAEVMDGPFVAALATCARSLARPADLGPAETSELAGAAACLAELGHSLLAAEATQAAARAYRRLGLRSRAQLCAETAAALLGRERVRTPLLAFDDTGTSLTAREREVALLAATHTSKEIAAQIGVAVSTVNNHLAQAYIKLGVSGRRELATLLDVKR